MTAAGRGFRTWFPVAVLSTLLIAVPLIALLQWLLRAPAKPTILIYGDSLTVQSKDEVRDLNAGSGYRVVFRAEPGTAMCDFVERAAFDNVMLHPARVVLAFTGNTATCAREAFAKGGAAGATALYERSLRQMRASFPALTMTLLIPPATHNLPNGWFPFNGDPQLVAMYERVGRELHMNVNTDADTWLTPNHVYRQKAPAFPHGSLVDVRLSDGVHLTDEGVRYYAVALLEQSAGDYARAHADTVGASATSKSAMAPGLPNR